MSLESKYQRLFDKASSPKTLDIGRSTIYAFDRYCKHCGQGLIQPKRFDRRTLKALFKKSFCSDKCKKLGKREESTFPISANGSPPGVKKEHIVEEMAFIAIELQKRDKVSHPVLKLIQRARQNYRLLSEQLAFLEAWTGEKWYESKFYYWVSKI